MMLIVRYILFLGFYLAKMLFEMDAETGPDEHLWRW